MGDDERAEIGRRHRTPAFGVEFEDVTGQYEGEELEKMRRARAAQDPAARIALLEAGYKELTVDVGEIKVSVADIRGDQKAAAVSLKAIETSLERQAERDHAEQLDGIDARKSRRAVIVKAIGLLLSGGVIGKVLHMLGVL